MVVLVVALCAIALFVVIGLRVHARDERASRKFFQDQRQGVEETAQQLRRAYGLPSKASSSRPNAT